MEEAVQSNQMDLDKEEARPGLDLESLLQETHIWRIPEFPPIPHGLYQQPLTLTLILKLLKIIFVRVEPLLSGSHRNITVPIQNLVQSSQRRGVGNIYKPLEGGHELLLTNQEVSGSGEAHRTFRGMESLFLQRKGQKLRELAQEPKYFIHRPEERVGNDPSYGERRTSNVNQLQKSPKDLRISRELQRTLKESGTDLTQKGTGSLNWNLQP
ncbi:hypothetical protein O181_012431 [Austropuccinia psidii MF-1]|uniref:Uncharacterized protein n=1 Tax=Austropuccinia psidii MF-1 TaxID=1389203 RepID=A0A9Q3BXT7_9BASI|nr:hypothetical protein [Austropuccinia psidii MF-1]